MKRLGILINNYGPSQLAYNAIRIANDIVATTDVEPTLFYENLVLPCLRPMCSVMCFNELFSFNGLIITTSIKQTRSVIKYPNPSKVIFYAWDLEWLRGPSNFTDNVHVYRSTKVITRSNDYAKAISNFANIEVDVIEDFNIKKLLYD
jgi:hypothetical protein